MDERAVHQDHGQDERIRRVEGGQHLIAGERDGARVGATAFDLEESKAFRSRVTAFDVVATIFGCYVDRLESGRSLAVHGRLHRPGARPAASIIRGRAGPEGAADSGARVDLVRHDEALPLR